MQVWGTIFNFFGALMVMIMVIVIHKVDLITERNFEEVRLKYAVDYAAEAAFSATLEADDLALDYTDLSYVRINPANCLDTFKSLMCLSYDMSMSKSNFAMLENYIPTAVLATNDGYYIASMQEVDTDPNDGVDGSEYQLVWSLKKPYIMDYKGKIYAISLLKERWVSADISDGVLEISSDEEFPYDPNEISAEEIRSLMDRTINKLVTADINYTIQERNKLDQGRGSDRVFYLPSELTESGVNPIKRPSLLIFVQGVDFAGSSKLTAYSVGGVEVTKKDVVIGFRENGIKYYCYEGQLPASALSNAEQFFDSVEGAALMGYYPHYEYLSRPRK